MRILTLRHRTSRNGGFGYASAAQAPRRNGVATGGLRKSQKSAHGAPARFEGKIALTTTLWTATGRSVRCTLWRKSSRSSLDS